MAFRLLMLSVEFRKSSGFFVLLQTLLRRLRLLRRICLRIGMLASWEDLLVEILAFQCMQCMLGRVPRGIRCRLGMRLCRSSQRESWLLCVLLRFDKALDACVRLPRERAVRELCVYQILGYARSQQFLLSS